MLVFGSAVGAAVYLVGRQVTPDYTTGLFGRHLIDAVRLKARLATAPLAMALDGARCGSNHGTAAARADGIIVAADADIELVAGLDYPRRGRHRASWSIAYPGAFYLRARRLTSLAGA